MKTLDRRRFIGKTLGAAAGASTAGLTVLPSPGWAAETAAEGLHIIGPLKGFTPQVGTLVSMMNWMRTVVLSSVKGLSQSDLDFLFDEKANTIGAMLLHLAATETFYQANTFEGRSDYNEQERQRWGAAMQLGEEGRKNIRGHNLDYYLAQLNEVRDKTLLEFRKRDDAWLATVDPSFFGKQPTNNYCKWFHVCEHESNHNGQIKWLLSRLPGRTGGKD